MSSCDQMYHLFLRENFFIWTLGAMGPASQIPGEVSVCWGLCFVNSRAPCKYIKRGRLPHQGTKIAFPPNFFSHLHPSNVTFPTELHAPCPFPASPYYGENWHSGPCPLCQLAESVEGRCSISDITTKFSRLSERSPPRPLRARELAPFPALALCPPISFPSGEASRHRWACQREHPLISSLPPASPSPLSSPSDPQKFVNDVYSEAKRKQNCRQEESGERMV